jgi:hypothetical protein
MKDVEFLYAPGIMEALAILFPPALLKGAGKRHTAAKKSASPAAKKKAKRS